MDEVEPRAAAPLAAALERVGDRWSLLIVEALLSGPLRFTELRTGVAGIAPNILTERLRRLEIDGLLRSSPYSRRPLRLEYALTADGRDLAGVLHLLADWGARRGLAAGEDHVALHHAACGTALEARWYCPTCGLVLPEGEIGQDGGAQRV